MLARPVGIEQRVGARWKRDGLGVVGVVVVMIAIIIFVGIRFLRRIVSVGVMRKARWLVGNAREGVVRDGWTVVEFGRTPERA
jgi:hypothetical protein